MSTPQQIAELLALVARQDKAAFAEVYRATSSKLYGIVLRILHRRDLADEVLQEVYVKIWERAGDFDARMASRVGLEASLNGHAARASSPGSGSKHTPIRTFDAAGQISKSAAASTEPHI